MVADNAQVASSTFEPAPRKRHERRASTSQVGRGGWVPAYAHIASPPKNKQSARLDLLQLDEDVRQVPSGELNSAVIKSSAFGVYKVNNRDSSGIMRHQRSSSCSLIGRAGAQCSGAYTKFGRENLTREEKLRNEFLKALQLRDLEALHNIYLRENTQIPFENMEIRKWRNEVQHYIIDRLKEASTQQEFKDAIHMANLQVLRFPYAKSAKESKAYQRALQMQDEAPEDPQKKVNKTVSIDHEQEVHEFSSPERTTFGNDEDVEDAEDGAGSMLDGDSDVEEF